MGGDKLIERQKRFIIYRLFQGGLSRVVDRQIPARQAIFPSHIFKKTREAFFQKWRDALLEMPPEVLMEAFVGGDGIGADVSQEISDVPVVDGISAAIDAEVDGCIFAGVGLGEADPFSAVGKEVAVHGTRAERNIGSELTVLAERAFHDLGNPRQKLGIADGGIDEVMRR